MSSITKKNIKSFFAVLFAVILLVPFYSCSSESENTEGKLSIVATLFPQYDFASQIVGDKAKVSLLLTPGTESHDYELTNSDMLKIKQCDLFIYTGVGMETWVSSISDTLNSDEIKVLDLSQGIELIELSGGEEHVHGADEEEGEGTGHSDDPHIWTSPVNAIKMLDRVYEAIVSLDGENEEYYKENYETYRGRLVSLDAEFREIAAEAKNKTLYFTGKFAFLYFTVEYGFDYVAPFNSCGEHEGESIASVAELITQIKDNNVKYVFYEELSSSSVKNAVLNETSSEALLFHSAHNLGKDDFQAGKSYVDIMLTNAENLRKAVG